jgi:hypothetical protein
MHLRAECGVHARDALTEPARTRDPDFQLRHARCLGSDRSGPATRPDRCAPRWEPTPTPPRHLAQVALQPTARWYGPLTVLRPEKNSLNALIEPTAEYPDTTVDGASDLAIDLLTGVGGRIAHSNGVVARARDAEHLLGAQWRSAIPSAAWLHDIGYADDAIRTGFHQLDGAQWLAARGWPMDVCRLVAWHTGAGTEARLRGQEDELVAGFEAPPALAIAVLTWADLTTSPLGAPWTVERRLADIFERHPPDSIVHRATLAAQPALLEAVATVEALLRDPGPLS